MRDKPSRISADKSVLPNKVSLGMLREICYQLDVSRFQDLEAYIGIRNKFPKKEARVTGV